VSNCCIFHLGWYDVYMKTLPKTRKEAKTLNSPRYNTGKACKHGHFADRFTSSGTCSECLAPRRRAHARKWAKENPEEKKRRAAEWYKNNTEAIIERVRDNYYKDLDRSRERGREYAATHKQEAIERNRAWREANPDYVRRHYKTRNKEALTAGRAKYRAARRNAVPPWLTDEHKEQIKEIYKLRRTLSESTGVEHQVDHIVPLQGGTVCGLHVPWNLRVITAEENNTRPRLWEKDDVDPDQTTC